MSRVIVTAGSSIGRGSDAGREDWPVGLGEVRDTLTEEGKPAEALVLMREPALPGRDVVSWPVAVLHLEGDRPYDTFLCVSEDQTFIDLADLADLPRWHAATEVWLAVLDRLDPRHAHHVTACSSKVEPPGAVIGRIERCGNCSGNRATT